MSASVEPQQESAERARIAADLVHQHHPVEVGGALDLARIAVLEDGRGGQHDGAAADKIAQQHSEQQRQAGALHDRPHAVAVRHVPDLVRDDAGELVRALGFVDQALVDVDAPARQRDRIGLTGAHHCEPERIGQAGRRLQLAHQLVEGRPARFLAGAAAALEVGSELAAVERGPYLRVDRRAHPALERVGNERGQPGRDRRQAHDRDQQQRGGRRHRPEHDPPAHLPFAAAAAVDRLRQLIDRGGQFRIADLEPRQHRIAEFADAEHMVRRRHGLELVIAPLRQHARHPAPARAERWARARPSRRGARWSCRRRRWPSPSSS